MQVRRKIGKYLKGLRKNKGLLHDQVVIELSDLGIDCSQSNLSRIELDHSTIRADILAGLCIIYEVDPRVVLYRGLKLK